MQGISPGVHQAVNAFLEKQRDVSYRLSPVYSKEDEQDGKSYRGKDTQRKRGNSSGKRKTIGHLAEADTDVSLPSYMKPIGPLRPHSASDRKRIDRRISDPAPSKTPWLGQRLTMLKLPPMQVVEEGSLPHSARRASASPTAATLRSPKNGSITARLHLKTGGGLQSTIEGKGESPISQLPSSPRAVARGPTTTAAVLVRLKELEHLRRTNIDEYTKCVTSEAFSLFRDLHASILPHTQNVTDEILTYLEKQTQIEIDTRGHALLDCLDEKDLVGDDTTVNNPPQPSSIPSSSSPSLRDTLGTTTTDGVVDTSQEEGGQGERKEESKETPTKTRVSLPLTLHFPVPKDPIQLIYHQKGGTWPVPAFTLTQKWKECISELRTEQREIQNELKKLPRSKIAKIGWNTIVHEERHVNALDKVDTVKLDVSQTKHQVEELREELEQLSSSFEEILGENLSLCKLYQSKVHGVFGSGLDVAPDILRKEEQRLVGELERATTERDEVKRNMDDLLQSLRDETRLRDAKRTNIEVLEQAINMMHREAEGGNNSDDSDLEDSDGEVNECEDDVELEAKKKAYMESLRRYSQTVDGGGGNDGSSIHSRRNNSVCVTNVDLSRRRMSVAPSSRRTSMAVSNDISHRKRSTIGARQMVGRGTGPDVPVFLRYEGLIPQEELSKGDVELIIKQVWSLKTLSDQRQIQRGGQKTGIVDFFHQYALNRFRGRKNKAAAFSYNFVRVLKENLYDADLELFDCILLKGFSEDHYYDQMAMLVKLKTIMASLSVEVEGDQVIEKGKFVLLLSKFFPRSDEEAVAELVEMLDTFHVSEVNDSAYSRESILEESEDGDQSEFMECLRDQYLKSIVRFHVAAKAEFFRLASRGEEDKEKPKSEYILTAAEFESALRLVDPQKTDEEIRTLLIRGLDDQYFISTQTEDIYSFYERLRRGYFALSNYWDPNPDLQL